MEIDQMCQSRPSLNSQSSESDQKGSRLAKNDQKWEALQDEIHLLYIVENKSLAMTMKTILEKFGFEASPRKWKMKLKEWGYEKNLSEQDMQVIVAKAEKRAIEEGKETVFLHYGRIMPDSKIENFKKRNVTKQAITALSSNRTPGSIRYFTPSAFSPWRGDLRDEGLTLPPLINHKSILGANSLRNEMENLNLTNVLSSSDWVRVPENINFPFIDSILLDFAETPQSAAAACHRAIDEFCQFALPWFPDENHTVLYKSLSKLARFQHQHGLLVDCTSTYRGALATFDVTDSRFRQIYKLPPDLQSIIIQDIEALADVLSSISSKRQDVLEAKKLYYFVYGYYTQQGDISARVRCSVAAARLFRGSRSYRKQLRILHSTLVEVLKVLLSSFKNLPRGEFLHLLLESIEVCYTEEIELGPLAEVKSEFLWIENLYLKEITLTTFSDRTKFLTELIGAMIRLATRFSKFKLEEVIEQDTANSIFELCSKFTDSLPLNIETHLAWVSHLEGQGIWIQCRSKLLKIVQMLGTLDNLPDTMGEEMNRLLAHEPRTPVYHQQRLYYDWYAAPGKSIARAVDYIRKACEVCSINLGLNPYEPCMPKTMIMPKASQILGTGMSE